MNTEEQRLDHRVVLYPYEESEKANRLVIECVPEANFLRKNIGIHIFDKVVPGRKVFPADRDIPLAVYDEKRKKTFWPIAKIRMDYNTLARTGTGKITNIGFIATSLKYTYYDRIKDMARYLMDIILPPRCAPEKLK